MQGYAVMRYEGTSLMAEIHFCPWCGKKLERRPFPKWNQDSNMSMWGRA